MSETLDPKALESDRARLLELLRTRSYEKRLVTLSSGKQSDFYIDCKKVMLLAEGHYLIGRLFLERIRKLQPRPVAVGGLTLGADPLASAVSLTSWLAREPLSAFIVRKEPKGHGTGQWMEGRSVLNAGDPVVVVEDVVTTGGSTIKALERVEAEGLRPLFALALVDRQEGGREAIEAKGYRLETLFTRADFVG